jgi:glycosyltransferase involved in cell wall biosynthesis
MTNMKHYKVIAIIPAYNEEKNIGNVIRNTKKKVDRIIVVDDGSKDATSKVSKDAGAQLIRLKRNMGVGFASRTGLKIALNLKPDVIIFLDGDGQLDPVYIPKFIDAIQKGADYVYGRRDLSNYPIDRKIGNFGLTFLSNLLCPTGIMDNECGYRTIKFEAAKKLNLRANGYEREMDFVYEVWRNKFKISYVSIRVKKFYAKFAIIRGLKEFYFLLKRRFGII